MTDSGSNKPSDRRRADPLQEAAETLAQEEAESEGETSESTARASDTPTSRESSRSDDREAEQRRRLLARPWPPQGRQGRPSGRGRQASQGAGRRALVRRVQAPCPRPRRLRHGPAEGRAERGPDRRRQGQGAREARGRRSRHQGARAQGGGRDPAHGTAAEGRRERFSLSDLRGPARPDEQEGPTPEQRAALRGSGQTAADFAAEGGGRSPEAPRRSRWPRRHPSR